MSAIVIVTALVAGALGAVLRYAVTRAFVATPARVRAVDARRLPLAVLIVNVAGALVAGVVLAVAANGAATELRYVLLSGFAGGLTTFSTFGVETVQLALDGRWRVAVGSVLANLVFGLAAVSGAWAATTAILG